MDTNLEEKLLSKVEKIPLGCWLFRGALCDGYGRIFINGKSESTHRVSWIVYKGPIPNGLFVLHKCDVRNCVNPDHLFLGTHKDNMQDMKNKGRGRNSGRSRVSKTKQGVEYVFLRCELKKSDYDYLMKLAEESEITLSQLVREALKPLLVNKPQTPKAMPVRPEGMDELMWLSMQR